MQSEDFCYVVQSIQPIQYITCKNSECSSTCFCFYLCLPAFLPWKWSLFWYLWKKHLFLGRTGPLRELSHTWFIFDWRSHLALPLCQARLPTHVSAFGDFTCYFDTIRFNVFCDGIAFLRRPSQLFRTRKLFFFFPRVVLGSDVHQEQTALPEMLWFIHYFQFLQSLSEAAYHTLLSLWLYLSSLSAVDAGEKNKEGGIENVSCSVCSRIKPDESSLVFSSCDKRELIEMLLSNMFILLWVLIFSNAFLLSSGTEKKTFLYVSVCLRRRKNCYRSVVKNATQHRATALITGFIFINPQLKYDHVGAELSCNRQEKWCISCDWKKKRLRLKILYKHPVGVFIQFSVQCLF